MSGGSDLGWDRLTLAVVDSDDEAVWYSLCQVQCDGADAASYVDNT